MATEIFEDHEVAGAVDPANRVHVGVAHPQEERVAEIGCRQWVVVVRSGLRQHGPPRKIELVPPVIDPVEELAVATRHIDRLEDEERR